MKSAAAFLDELSGYQLAVAQDMELSGWGRRTQHWDTVSCGWGMGADPGVQVQNLWVLVEAEVLLVSPCLSGDMGAGFEDRCGMDMRFGTGKEVREVGHGFEEVWVVAMPVTGILLGREAD